MAIAVDSTSAGSATTGAALSWSHTCTGTNLGLLVWVLWRGARPVTAVSYNGVAMTQVGTNQTSGTLNAALWSLLGPATGPNTIQVTLSGTGDTLIGGTAISLTGANQSTGFDTANALANLGTSTTPTLGPVTAAGGNYVAVGCSTNANTAFTAGETLELSTTTTTTVVREAIVSATAANPSFAETITATDWIMQGVPVIAVAAPPSYPAGYQNKPPLNPSYRM